MPDILKMAGLTKRFGGTQAVSDFSAEIRTGAITGLIGPNGCGKTTLFNLITGFLRPDAGEIKFDGLPVLRRRPQAIVRLGIGRTFQEMRLIRKMSVAENILLSFPHNSGESVFGALLWRWGHFEKANSARLDEIIDFVQLGEVRRHPASEISYGQQKLLSIGCVLSLSPRLLLLDEPFSGLSPVMIQKISGLLKTLVASGKTIFLIEHNLQAVEKGCDDVIVMNEGKKLVQGPPTVIRDDPRVLEAYLS